MVVLNIKTHGFCFCFRFEFRMAASGNNQVKPDHIIIWLDKNMGVPENNIPSRAILDENATLDRPLESEYSAEIDDLIFRFNPELKEKKFEDLIKSPLRMFIDESECIKCINDSIQANKKVFLITSGQMGKLIVPKIYDKLSGSIYIFCGQINLHEEWTKPYQNGIEIYDDEKGVFAKVLSDIGIYYLTKGQNETSNEAGAIQYLYWARRLFASATKLDNIKRKDYLKYVRDELVERNASTSGGDNYDVQMAEDADDD